MQKFSELPQQTLFYTGYLINTFYKRTPSKPMIVATPNLTCARIGFFKYFLEKLVLSLSRYFSDVMNDFCIKMRHRRLNFDIGLFFKPESQHEEVKVIALQKMFYDVI